MKFKAQLFILILYQAALRIQHILRGSVRIKMFNNFGLQKYKLNHQPYILFEIRNTIKYLTRLKVKLEKKLKIEKLNDDFNFF